MAMVTIGEAKTQLSRLLQRVAAGETITIANRGVPVARLVRVTSGKRARKLGVDREKIRIADDFDAPLPASVLIGFLGGKARKNSEAPLKYLLDTSISIWMAGPEEKLKANKLSS